MKRLLMYFVSWTIIGLGFFGFLHHLGGPEWYSTWGTHSVEMAISTAFGFVLIGLVFLFMDIH